MSTPTVPSKSDGSTHQDTQGQSPSIRSFDAILVALFATAVSGAAVSRPSFWLDEIYTISLSANLTLPELWQQLLHRDAAHGFYDLLMYGWFAIFPVTEFWSRLPSCMAAAVGAAGVVVLTGHFCARRVALSAGILFAILPRITYAAIDARPYAIVAMASVWLTVLFVRALRRNTLPAWVGYSVLAVLAILLSMFTSLTVVAHGVALTILTRDRSLILRWASAAGAAFAACAPLFMLNKAQDGDYRWIPPISSRTTKLILQEQYFEYSMPFAALAGVVIAVASVFFMARPKDRRAVTSKTRDLLIVSVAWILVPTTIAVAYSLAWIFRETLRDTVMS